MKTLIFAILATTIILLIGHSFVSKFSTEPYVPQPEQVAPAQTPGGGAPRKTQANATTTPVNPGNFRGPTGQPHIVGPSAPPPGQ